MCKEHHDCPDCQCHQHPPCSHCVEGHDLSLEERCENVRINWHSVKAGEHITASGIEFLIMTGQDYIDQDGVAKFPYRPYNGNLTAIPIDLIDEHTYDAIRTKYGFGNTPTKPWVKRDGREITFTIYATAAREDLFANATERHIYHINEGPMHGSWRVVTAHHLMQNKEHYSDSRFCRREAKLYLVPLAEYNALSTPPEAQSTRLEARPTPGKVIISGATPDHIIIDDINDDKVDALSRYGKKAIEAYTSAYQAGDLSEPFIDGDPSLVRPRAEHENDNLGPFEKSTTTLSGPLADRYDEEIRRGFEESERITNRWKVLHHAAQSLRPSRSLREDLRLGVSPLLRDDLDPDIS